MRVLFLFFNLVLADQIAQMVEDIKLATGEIVAKSWESFVQEVLAKANIDLEIPEPYEERREYFLKDIPGLVCTIFEDGSIGAEYDALVVDEAQDHDTAFVIDQPEFPLGWWSWYLRLLKYQHCSPVAIFLDTAQRPHFRMREQFSLKLLRDAIPTATHIRLKRVLRYTRNLHAYLVNLPFPVAEEFATLALPAEELPLGEPVIQCTVPEDRLVDEIDSIVRSWTSGPQKRCKVDDIVIMGYHRSLETSRALEGVTEIAGYPLVDLTHNGPLGQLRYIGIHRAKGLDFLGVILIDQRDPMELAQDRDTERQDTFFHGATRARQLLAVVGRGDQQ